MRVLSHITLAIGLVCASCSSNDGGTQPPQDTTPPGRITSLEASVETESIAVVTWRAPGDDEATGIATRYDLRWFGAPLGNTEWTRGVECPDPPVPTAAGSPETYRATGLPPDSSIVFQIRSVDEAANWSPASNAAPLVLPPAQPLCSVAAETLEFGVLTPGQSATRTLTIRNSGGGLLEGQILGGTSEFTLVSGGDRFQLAHNMEHSATIRFEPNSPGGKEAEFSIGIETCPSIRCTGVGQGPVCRVDAAELDFGSVPLGGEAVEEFLLSNVGTERLTGNLSTSCSAFSVISGEGPFSLEPDEHRVVRVRFRPEIGGETTCTLDLGNTLCPGILCSGWGLGPQCGLQGTQHDFGSVPLGSTATWSFSIRNSGGGIVSGEVQAPTCDEFLLTEGAGPFHLEHQDQHEVTVGFAPSREISSSCTIELGSMCGEVQVQGVGTSPTCVIDPDSLDFGSVLVGDTVEREFTLTNPDLGRVQGFISSPCPEFVVFRGAGTFSLAPGESRIVGVRYTPITSGSHACAIGTAGVCGPVACRGEATGTHCQVEPEVLDFGSVPFGTEAVRDLEVRNTGAGELSGSVSISGPGFSIVHGGGDFSLPPNASQDVRVRFLPRIFGEQTCELALGTPGCPRVVGRGIGLSPCMIAPSEIDFGSAALRANADTTITIFNAGDRTIGGLVALDGSTQFSIIEGGGPINLAPGGTHTIGVRFRPFVIEDQTATLAIGSCQAVPIRGRGFDPPPVCRVSVDSLAFRLETVGDAAPSRPFSIRNTGGQVLEGNVSLTSPDFEILVGAGPYRLLMDEVWSVVVQFSPAEVGTRSAVVELGTSDCAAVSCEGYGVSYRMLGEMSQIDDIARLHINGAQAFTAWYGRTGTDRTGWEHIGHFPGNSGVFDFTSSLVPGANELRFTLENTVCCGATVRMRVWKDSATLFSEDFVDETTPPIGVVYDRTITVEATIE